MSHATATGNPEPRTTSLEELPRELAKHVRGRWDMTLHNGRDMSVAVEATRDWVLLDAPLPRRRGASARRGWRWLRWNADLPAGVKLVLDADLRAHARAELPRSSVLEKNLASVAAGVREAACVYRRGRSGPRSLTRAPCAERDLGSLCGETEWPFHEGGTTVALEVADAFVHAEVGALEDGALVVSVTLATWPAAALGRTSRAALGLLMLTVSGMLRQARASASERSEERVGVDLEVVLPPDATGADVADALTVLSVGARLCTAEVRALEDEELAGSYLALRGWSS